MQLPMWILLLAFTVVLHATEDVNPGKWPQPLADLPRWVRHPEDWPDAPTVPPPDPQVVKLQAHVGNLLSKVKQASIPPRQLGQWNLAAHINDTKLKRAASINNTNPKLVASINDTKPERQGLVLVSVSSGLKRWGSQASEAMAENEEALPGALIPPPEHFHAANKLFRESKRLESHLAGMAGADDIPDEFLWRNLSTFQPRDRFNSTFWAAICADNGASATGVWKEICLNSYDVYHLRFDKTICSDDVKAITGDITIEEECAHAVARDAECSKVFYFIPDKSAYECKCVKKDKLCKPADNDKGGQVFWLE